MTSQYGLEMKSAGRALTLGAVMWWTGSAAGDESAAGHTTPDGQILGLFVGLGNLGSPGAYGGAALAGLRWQPLRHFAASLDLGYGLMSTSPGVQDRWWVVPTA